MKPTEIWSVGDVTRYIKRLLERDAHLEDVWIRGEISNFTHHSSGHMYFTLKDKESRIKVVMFASYNRFLTFIPKDGTKAIVRGSISVFERDGAYQLYAREIQPDGLGSLYLAFEQLKETLQKEGLFAPERKRLLPRFPQKVGVITSPTGAAIRDIITTIKRRYPQTAIIIAPATVQGVDAPRSVIRAIQLMNRHSGVDVLIVGRGGGSIEELWGFNDEQVARAIAASTIPIISAVGHETDFTIADFVADVRAATPTAAAELAVPDYREWVERAQQLDYRLHRAVQDRLSAEQERLIRLRNSYGLRQPRRLVMEKQQRLDQLTTRLRVVVKQAIKRKREQATQLEQRLQSYRIEVRLHEQRERISRTQVQLTQLINRRLDTAKREWVSLVNQLDALSPLKVMQRGFSLTYKADQLIKTTDAIEVGDNLMIRVTDGTVHTTVTGKRKEYQDGAKESGTDNRDTV